MEIKDLVRQVADAERLAEWGRLLLQQIQEVEALKQQLAAKEADNDN